MRCRIILSLFITTTASPDARVHRGYLGQVADQLIPKPPTNQTTTAILPGVPRGLTRSCSSPAFPSCVGHDLRKATDRAATSVPACGLIVTDCLSPWVRMSRRAVKPAPATFATISAAPARPEIFPDTPRVASAQEPESEPPSEMTLLLISTL